MPSDYTAIWRAIVNAMARYDDSLLTAALLGYEQERDRIERQIAELRQRLGVRAAGPLKTVKPARKKRSSISPEGRKRIAEAQRKRWAAQKKRQ
jgi:hypothetical protein